MRALCILLFLFCYHLIRVLIFVSCSFYVTYRCVDWRWRILIGSMCVLGTHLPEVIGVHQRYIFKSLWSILRSFLFVLFGFFCNFSSSLINFQFLAIIIDGRCTCNKFSWKATEVRLAAGSRPRAAA